MKRLPLLLSAIAILHLGQPSLGHAQSPTPSASVDPDAAAQQARAAYDRGASAVKKKEWDKAREAFSDAWAHKRHWQIGFSLGGVELELGMYLQAAEHLRACVAEVPSEEPEAKQAASMLTKAEAHLGRIAISVDLPGARVFVDDREVGTSPIAEAVWVEPGQHVVRAEKDSESKSATVDVSENRMSGVKLSITPAPAPVVTSAPVLVPPAPPRSAPDYRREVLIAGSVVGAAGLLIAIVGGAAAMDLASQADTCAKTASCLTSDQVQSIHETHNTWRSVALGGLVGFGVVASTTLVIGLTWKTTPPNNVPTSGRVMLVPSTRGVVVRGTW